MSSLEARPETVSPGGRASRWGLANRRFGRNETLKPISNTEFPSSNSQFLNDAADERPQETLADALAMFGLQRDNSDSAEDSSGLEDLRIDDHSTNGKDGHCKNGHQQHVRKRVSDNTGSHERRKIAQEKQHVAANYTQSPKASRADEQRTIQGSPNMRHKDSSRRLGYEGRNGSNASSNSPSRHHPTVPSTVPPTVASAVPPTVPSLKTRAFLGEVDKSEPAKSRILRQPSAVAKAYQSAWTPEKTSKHNSGSNEVRRHRLNIKSDATPEANRPEGNSQGSNFRIPEASRINRTPSRISQQQSRQATSTVRDLMSTISLTDTSMSPVTVPGGRRNTVNSPLHHGSRTISKRYSIPPPPKVEPTSVVKLLLLGDSAVGKSSLLIRLCCGSFETSHITTIGVDFKSKVVSIGPNGENVKLQVWDTAGQERFRNLTPVYFRTAMGVILVFAVNSRSSFESIAFWMSNLDEMAAEDISRCIVGNKTDLKREVSREEAESLAAHFQVPYFETSAKTNSNVDSPFLALAQEIISKNGQNPRLRPDTVKLTGDDHYHKRSGNSLTGALVSFGSCCKTS